MYTRLLRRFIGDVDYTNGFYAAPEALIGKALPDGSERYELLDSNSYVEFLPIDCECGTVTAEELVPGHQYEVVITNNAGLYRYRLGDVIRCASNDCNSTTFTVEYRRDQVHSFSDENLTEADVQSAVLAMGESLNLSIADFCFQADKTECCYTVYIEPSIHDKGEERLAAIPAGLLNTLCEAALMLNNPRYAQTRLNGTVNPCRVKILQPQTQLLYRDREKMRRQTAPDMFVPLRLLDEKQGKFFKLLIEQIAK